MSEMSVCLFALHLHMYGLSSYVLPVMLDARLCPTGSRPVSLSSAVGQHWLLQKLHPNRQVCCRGEYCTVSSDGTIRGWDVTSHAQLFELAAPGEVIQCCAYHPDRHELACGFDQGRVRIFDIAETALLQEHKQHRQGVLQVLYLPSGKLLFSLGQPSPLIAFCIIKHGARCQPLIQTLLLLHHQPGALPTLLLIRQAIRGLLMLTTCHLSCQAQCKLSPQHATSGTCHYLSLQTHAHQVPAYSPELAAKPGKQNQTSPYTLPVDTHL